MQTRMYKLMAKWRKGPKHRQLQKMNKSDKADLHTRNRLFYFSMEKTALLAQETDVRGSFFKKRY